MEERERLELSSQLLTLRTGVQNQTDTNFGWPFHVLERKLRIELRLFGFAVRTFSMKLSPYRCYDNLIIWFLPHYCWYKLENVTNSSLLISDCFSGGDDGGRTHVHNLSPWGFKPCRNHSHPHVWRKVQDLNLWMDLTIKSLANSYNKPLWQLSKMEYVEGIEPSHIDWKSTGLPLTYTYIWSYW